MTESIAFRSHAVSETIERALAERRDGFTQLVAFETLCRSDVSAEAREAYLKGLRPVVEGLGGSLVNMVIKGASVQSLGTRTLEGRTGPLFRLRQMGRGLNYLMFAVNTEGGIIDWYPFDLGEWFVDGQARMSPFSTRREGAASSLTRFEELIAMNSHTLVQMSEGMQRGTFAGVLGAYWSLPSELQAERGCLRMRIAAAAQLDETAYKSALSDFLGRFSGQLGTDLTAIDGYLLLGKPDESLAALDRLEAVLQDPLLGLMRAGVLGRIGRRDEAKTALEKVTTAAPADLEAYWSLIGLAMQDGQYGVAARWLTAVKQLGVAIADLNTVKEYKGFVASPEGKQWLQQNRVER